MKDLGPRVGWSGSRGSGPRSRRTPARVLRAGTRRTRQREAGLLRMRDGDAAIEPRGAGEQLEIEARDSARSRRIVRIVTPAGSLVWTMLIEEGVCYGQQCRRRRGTQSGSISPRLPSLRRYRMLTASVSALRNTTKVSRSAFDPQRGVLDRHRLDGIARWRARSRAAAPAVTASPLAGDVHGPGAGALPLALGPLAFELLRLLLDLLRRLPQRCRPAGALAVAAQHVIAARVHDDLGAEPVFFLRQDDLRGDRAVVEEPLEPGEPLVDQLPERG